MNTPVLKNLKAMVGKTYMYKGENIVIKNYHLMETGTCKIDLESGKVLEVKDISKFTTSCLEVEQESSMAPAVIQETNSIMTTLQQTLLDNIAKVKKDPSYIKQANVVNSSVNSLIGLTKLHIQVNKMKR